MFGVPKWGLPKWGRTTFSHIDSTVYRDFGGRKGLYKSKGHRFPCEIISHTVWLYHRFTLSLRDVEDLRAERGVVVSDETIRCWCFKFGSQYAKSIERSKVS